MQKVTKDEFLQASDYPELLVMTKKNEITFRQGDYTVRNDTIYGQGTSKTINNIEEPFDSTLGLTDVEEIQIEEFNVGNTIVLASVTIIIVVGFLTLAITSTWSLNFK